MAMSDHQWLATYQAQLEAEHLIAQPIHDVPWFTVPCCALDAEDWSSAARIALHMQVRHAGLWVDSHEANETDATSDLNSFTVYALLERDGDYVLLRTNVDYDRPELGAHGVIFPTIDRLERHAHDLTGLRFISANPAHRWTRHHAWRDDEYPLRPDFPISGYPPSRTPSDTDYPFTPLPGQGVYEIPVGPVHAGIIEPGHFRFQVAGEDVLQLETRLGYTHKGVEKLAVGRDAIGLARLAGRVSGDMTVAYTWAACQALERAVECEVPERALYWRAILSERERIANHLGDLGAICNDVGFTILHAEYSLLREDWQRAQANAFGHRLLMDQIIPGGIRAEPDANSVKQLRADVARLRCALAPLNAILNHDPSLADRFIGTGRLTTEQARRLGCTGVLGKASGIAYDVRCHHPYAPYDQVKVPCPTDQHGDVAARVRIRIRELEDSLTLLEQLHEALPSGSLIVADWPQINTERVALGIVDSWRGELYCFVRLDAQGRVARYAPRDPSWMAWPALEQLILGNIVPDFPVCNKSVNASYSGHDC
jgi:Ni,Fe-hydrogenase III large subunit/Ni,Fe-hydrogenase III component G